MTFFRLTAFGLPQALFLLLVGARLDWLGGLNHTDAGFGILIILFLPTPVVTTALFITEVVRYRLKKKNEKSPSFRKPKVAMLLMFEALALNIFILSELRMH